MSNAVQLQADIGGMGIQSLGAFSSILSTLSADNVTPMAMVQMENLGALFHTNGQFADQVPDKLKRFSLQPLGRVAISVGWRRGDSASLMADSSGGQAIALLSLCLVNLFSLNRAATILHRICSRVLPRTVNVCSVAQLRDVAEILDGKLQALGFGNYLAQQVMKIHSVYEQLGVGLPKDLLIPLTQEAVVDLLDCLQRFFSEDSAVLRITGIKGMGYVFALVLFMFPNNALITVETFILYEGSNTKKRIILELSQAASGPLLSRVETELKTEPFVELPIAEVEYHPFHACTFTWHGWMARSLQLSMLTFGMSCSEELLVAVCDLLVAVAFEIGNKPSGKNSIERSRHDIEAMLGEYPLHRMEQACEDILLVRPSATRRSVLSSFDTVSSICFDMSKDLTCLCQVECDLNKGWDYYGNSSTFKCPRRRFWMCFGSSLDCGLLSFLVNAGPNTAISPYYDDRFGEVTSLITATIGTYKIPFSHVTSGVYYRTMRMFSSSPTDLARSSASTTISATVLSSLQVPRSLLRTFELVDGQLVYSGRYHPRLGMDSNSDDRPKAEKSVVSGLNVVEPSNIGQHSHLSLTFFESIAGITMKATAKYAGKILSFPLISNINSIFALQATAKCSHPSSSPLEKSLNEMVMITSVAAPKPEGSRIGIVMTQSNPTAQFLSCRDGVRGLLLRDCCLNCAFRQAKEGGFDTIIVT